MEDKDIPSLPAAGTITGGEKIVVAQGANDVFITLTRVLNEFLAASFAAKYNASNPSAYISIAAITDALIMSKRIEGMTVTGGAITNATPLVDALGALQNQINTAVSSLAAKQNTAPTALTGSNVRFSHPATYGSVASPEAGNITLDAAGAIVGVTVLLIHNAGVPPTFGSEFKILNTSQAYAIGVLNYITMTYLSATKIIYSIAQE